MPWSITSNDVDKHIRMVPALIRWSRWERDAPWRALRSEIARPVPTTAATPAMRHLRLARILDFVGNRAHRAGNTNAQVLALCRQAADDFAAGRLHVVYDEVTTGVD